MGFGGKKSLYILTEERTPKYYIFAAELSKLANYDWIITENPEKFGYVVPSDGR